jgi:hypothetical protein
MKGDMQKTVDDQSAKQKLDLALDRELEATFPASDALKITRRQPDKAEKPRKHKSRLSEESGLKRR